MASIHLIETNQIEKAIEAFEAEVDFELVPVITQKSSYTEHVAWMLSFFLFMLFILGLDFLFQDSWESKTWYYLASPLVAYVLGHMLDKSDWVCRRFISKKERSRQSFQKAQRIFFLKHLGELKRHNSLILFISVMERRIVILPDPRMKLEGLQELQQKLLRLIQNEFRNDEFEKGFLKAIAFLQSELKAHFPKKSTGSSNEVSNKLIWWAD